MIMLMGIGRRSLIIVVMAVTALASAFDGCLMDCHPQAPASAAKAHAHCHQPSPQQAGARWQADPTCHHDHAAAAAESTVRIRLESRPLGVAASLQTRSLPPLSSISPVARRSITDRSGPALAIVPLRV